MRKTYIFKHAKIITFLKYLKIFIKYRQFIFIFALARTGILFKICFFLSCKKVIFLFNIEIRYYSQKRKIIIKKQKQENITNSIN